MIRVSLLDARDWSEKRGADRSIFSSGRLRQLLQKNVIFLQRLVNTTATKNKHLFFIVV
jgi:hypothetical protein